MRELGGGPASADQQAVLARWSSWGAVAQVFDEQNQDWAFERAQLRAVLDEGAWDQARRTTINAYFTDAAYVQVMWEALGRLGFTGGRVLEPGCGAGTFIGLAPESASMTGVELDVTTAAIAAALYPQASIRAQSFADSRFVRGSFDAVIGNVPFADVVLHDPVHNGAGLSMHNHFIVKSLELTRPGGMVMVLTSAWTLDGVNPAARRAMNDLADLVGAVRLPSGAHRRAAGTEALTDLLVLRRREPGRPKADVSWEKVSARRVDGQVVKVNTYFDLHPQAILGDLHVGTGMYGAATVHVLSDDLGATGERLRVALDHVVAEALEAGMVVTAPTGEQVARQASVAARATDLWDGTIVVGPGQVFQVAHGGTLVDLPVPRAQARELAALVGLRDAARDLLQLEAASLDGAGDLEVRRAELRGLYGQYVARYGPINRFTLRGTGRFASVVDHATGQAVLDPVTGQPVRGQEVMARIAPRAVVTFRQDPHSALVRALERFDEQTQTAAPAQLLEQRVVVPRPVRQGADSPADAIAMSMDRTGRVDLQLVADLLGVGPHEARTMLGTLVFDEPGTGRLVHAPEYLSGEVRSKLEAAQGAAGGDPRFAVNVEALQAVMPDPIGIEDIEARLGSVWISAEVHQQFLREILADRSVRVENPMPGAWEVRGVRSSLRATNEWGTDRRPATDLAQTVMEQRRVEVWDEYEDADGKKRRVLNPVETTAAQEKAEALQTRFAQWVWEAPDRARQLAEVYNRRFNSIVLRDYEQAGDWLTLPGLAATLTLRPHQRAAVARMIGEPTVGLFHDVGAGKTFEMIVGVTEMRRMGLVSKPAIVVPNHMLDQFSREWLQAYPAARILAASAEDLTGDRRRLFVARAAANDWDGIVLTQGAFKKISVSAQFQADYIGAELADLRDALTRATGEDAMSVKRIERRLLAVEERHKRALALPRDPGVGFEATGIDYLAIDEAHTYKNLATVSNITDAAIEGSQQAADLHMKLELLRARYGHRVATMATATPLANSITEAYVMQRYLRPDLLAAAGVTSFDGWAATFGSQVTEMELGPAGGFRLKTRFARFQNVPEMLRMWHVFADVKTLQDLHLPVPAIAPRAGDGRREAETVILEPTPQLQAYIAQIAVRADKVASRAVTPDVDNMLLISTDGRKAALDLRLVDQHATQDGPVKLDAVAAKIIEHWHQTRDNEYLDETGRPSPVRGGLQLVFCDLGTPSDKRWDAYHELAGKLRAAGMAPDEVRFIHDAKSDKDKARLFAAARGGHVKVLIGSTSKMGMGTNVQARITALHDIDCPWRPADVEQRHGRAIRQGNQNREVAMFRYVVERSFDAYSWQTVARKATFIAQVMRGKLDVREIEDIGDTALSAAEAKALASGNPLVLDKANADAAVAKLCRQQVAHQRSQAMLAHTVASTQQKIATTDDLIDQLRAAAARTLDVAGDAFSMHVAGQVHTTRTDAAAAIGAWASTQEYRWMRASEPVPFAELAGHTVTIIGRRTQLANYQVDISAQIALDGVPLSGSRFATEEIKHPTIGIIRTIEATTRAIGRTADKLASEVETDRRTLEEARTRLGAPFPHADALAEAERRAQAVTNALEEMAQPTPVDQAPQERAKSTDARPKRPGQATTWSVGARGPSPR